MKVGEVVVRNGGSVKVFGGSDLEWSNLIMIAAGDFGGGMPSRHMYRPPDEVMLHWIAAVRECKSGFCDRCRVIRALIARTGHGPDRVILDQYRRLETDTLDLLNHPKIKTAIHSIAKELMDAGRLSAACTSEILEQHLENKNVKGTA